MVKEKNDDGPPERIKSAGKKRGWVVQHMRRCYTKSNVCQQLKALEQAEKYFGERPKEISFY